MDKRSGHITMRAFLLGVLFAGVFAAVTLMVQRRDMFPTASQIPVLPYILLLGGVLALNPLCRILPRCRALSAAELLVIFTMGVVSSGISTFGLAGQLVPTIGGLFNPAWNNEQSEWNRHVVPYLNERYFLSEPGLREAARLHLHAHAEHREARRKVDAAERYLAARDRFEAARDAVDTDNTTAAQRNLVLAERAYIEAERTWNRLREQAEDLPPPRETLERYRGRLPELEAEAAAARAALASVEEPAFERVRVFRRGLPREEQAYPGIVWLPEDTWQSYRARLGRTLAGTRARRRIDGVVQLLDGAGDPPGARMLDAVAKELRAVEEGLGSVGEAGAGVARDVDGLREREVAMARELATLRAGLREMNARRRVAPREDMRRLDRAIRRGQRSEASMARRLNRLVDRRRALERQTETIARVSPLRAAVAGLAGEAENGHWSAESGAQLDRVAEAMPSIDGSWRRFFVGEVPWVHWAGPLARWALVVGLTYLVLMTFNVLIFRQWAHNERLIYPLAELPEALVMDAPGGGAASPIFRDGLFWAGFLISGLVLGYNVLAYSGLVPGFAPLEMNNFWDPYIEDTAFSGWLGGRFHRSHIFFTMIGLTFLIPKKISFSLWLFAVLSMIQVLILVWAGYGQSERSFQAEWWYTLNFRTSQGGGALIVFASVVLYKCRRYLLCAFRPRGLEGLDADERRELRISSFLFLAGSAGLILMLWRSMGANLWYSVVTYFIVMVITIGLTRAVAEGGILGFQAWVNPFHFIRTFFGMGRTWTHASLFSPLMVYYGVMFLDLKTFIAPAMANSLKIREDLRMQRGRFHAAMFAAILVAAVVAVAMSIMMAYTHGADAMSQWFYSRFPQSTFAKISEVAQVPPSPAPAQAIWVLAGAGVMAALLYFRQTAFWLPHPIGLIMLVNPLMGSYWFSILLGWLAKSLVTKYGSKSAYVRARTLFIGLIIGELLMVALSLWLSVRMGLSIPVHLNKN